MNKKGKIIVIFLVICGLLALVFNILADQSKNWLDDHFHGVWIFEHQKGKSRILLHSSEYRTSKGGGNTIHYLNLIDAKSGNILSSVDYNTGFSGSFSVEIKTKNLLWITSENEWKVLNLKDLTEVYDQSGFYAELIRLHPEIKNVYSIFFNESDGLFYVMNDQGEEFPVSAQEFDQKSNKKHTTVLTSYNQMGYDSYYSIDIINEEATEFIQVEEIGVEEDFDPTWNLVEKLDHDNGFSKNYAVILSNLECYLLDGNQRRSLKKITDSIGSLTFEKIYDEEWLNGELLRPFKDYGQVPTNRCVMHYNDQFSIYYSTSLDEEKNDCRLAAFHFIEKDIRWDISLSDIKIESGYKPVQNHIRHQQLFTLWRDDSFEFILTSIQPNTGEVEWVIDL